MSAREQMAVSGGVGNEASLHSGYIRCLFPSVTQRVSKTSPPPSDH